jgi:glutamate 5-kinase
MHRSFLKNHKRIVVKIGSNVIASRENGLNEIRMKEIAYEISEIRRRGIALFIVSSGAILCGAKAMDLHPFPKTLPMKQAAAAVGQSHLMWAYERLFIKHRIKVAQILLTRDDLANKKRLINARNTLLALLENKILPIINENDTVATEEIKFGDNDALAGQVARLVNATLLVILSDVDGLYTKDPRKETQAERIPIVEKVTKQIEKFALGKGLLGGTGGMASKVATAKKAAADGVATLILNGAQKGLIKRALQGEDLGTFFLPKITKPRMGC